MLSTTTDTRITLHCIAYLILFYSTQRSTIKTAALDPPAIDRLIKAHLRLYLAGDDSESTAPPTAVQAGGEVINRDGIGEQPKGNRTRRYKAEESPSDDNK
jgi:hypothetical protein